MNKHYKKGFKFSSFTAPYQTPFEKLLEIFKEIITYTSGDFDEAIEWLRQLDTEYKLTDHSYTIDDFIEDLKAKGYIKEEIDLDSGDGKISITAKTERAIRQQALNQIFGKIKRRGSGNHKSKGYGLGDEHTGDFRNYQFGDSLDKVSITESLRNAQINHGIADFNLTEDDLVIEETMHKAQMSTVLMIDISHSMILYGEDRITPAKKVAMALAELITTRYPKDTLDILVFGNDSWIIDIKDLPYLKVGPYHTNTVAGLQLAMDVLRRKRNNNKQIFMITDGKPSCIRMPDGQYYKNSNGLDSLITKKCYAMAQQARRLHIPITTFMIAFIDRIKTIDKTIEVYDTEVVNPQICSKETIQKLQKLLQNVVDKDHGTGHGLYTKNFSMAGKTGTCQKDYKNKEQLNYISTFSGYFPAENPEYSCIVVVHEPEKSVGYYGADVSGPVFKKIAQKIYTSAPVEDVVDKIEDKTPDVEEQYNSYYTTAEKYKTVMQNLKGLPAMDAIAILENMGLNVKLIGRGTVHKQSIRKGEKVTPKSTVILELT